VVLLQEGQTLSGRDDDLALAGLKLPVQDFEEGGFAGAVCTDDSVTVSFREFDVDVLEKCFLSDSQGNVACLYHVP
jgi:hypothetical protein